MGRLARLWKRNPGRVDSTGPDIVGACKYHRSKLRDWVMTWMVTYIFWITLGDSIETIRQWFRLAGDVWRGTP